jgi:methylglutaconyl-CoA hydratase
MSEYQHVTLAVEGKVARVTLNRPEVHNAFNAELGEEMRLVFEGLGSQAQDQGQGQGQGQGAPGVRAVVIAGEGRSFCAGADVNWMRASLDFSQAENVADALVMARMFDTINRCPLPVIGRVHGAALGGGVGLAAVCDVVVAAEGTVFGLSEVKLGIAPAVISPYVIAKIGRSQARALFLTGERFDANRALRIGLVHYVVPGEQLDSEIERICGEVLSASPQGIARAKWLIATVPELAHDEAMQLTAETIAALRTSPEGQEGLRAFLERRKPGWA